MDRDARLPNHPIVHRIVTLACSRPARMQAVLVLSTAAVLLASCTSTQEIAAQQAVDEPAPIEAGIAPPPGAYAPGFDALHYEIGLVLPDTGSFIEGSMQGRFRIVPPRRDTLSLDLTGLAVRHVAANGSPVAYRYDAGKLHIPLPAAANIRDTLEVAVSYAGHPDDGLILGRNLHGDPSVFADNWPNRARFWFPSIDHPSDKATVRFDVRMNPDTGRRVIANGTLEPSGRESVWRWAVEEPIPTYTMVVGAAAFDVETVGEACTAGRCTEVTTWFFSSDADRGAASFRRAADMVEYYSELIAPFPYAKLAHVQSSTRFGGMENVGAIFYPEEAIHEGRDIERTVAHETAHQWFGDAVTESDWHHLWLSEGFATYFAALFFEHADGQAAMQEVMRDYLESYVDSGAWLEPIVNPDQENLFDLLNANNYQKGAWVLHMLRNRLGDDVFFGGIRAYYRDHEHGTVLTEDFHRAMERVSGDSLRTFFDQWIYRPGHPRLAVEWSWSDEQVAVAVRQAQPASWPTFQFPLEIAFQMPDGSIRHTILVDERLEEVLVDAPDRPVGLTIDPDQVLLKEVLSVEPVSVR